MDNVIAFPPAPRCDVCNHSAPVGARLCAPCAMIWHVGADGALLAREEMPPFESEIARAAKMLAAGLISPFRWVMVE